MNFKELTEPECGGANPLMRLGQQLTNDFTLRDEGASNFRDPNFQPAENTFRMDMLLKEMQEMDKFVQQPIQAPSVINEVAKFKNQEQLWGPAGPKAEESMAEFWQQSMNPNSVVNQRAKQESNIWGFDQSIPSTAPFGQYRPYQRPDYTSFLGNQPQSFIGQQTANDFFKEIEAEKVAKPAKEAEDWAESFQETKKAEEEFNEQYNKEFWDRLQDEWKKLSEDNDSHPWLDTFSDYYDPYKEYKFDENNPMMSIENAFEKGKTFLENGDIPSAVLCFEVAVKQEPENAEAWQYLGTSQAENEKDPNAIAALKKSLELNPNNLKVLMALAISYTNESYQNNALKMLNQWMKINPKYSNLVPGGAGGDEAAGIEEIASSRIRGMELEMTQELFLSAVQQNAATGVFDVDVQEALGVLFNLSSEYEKAVDCFQAAVEMAPENAKLWNRLGASYANGNKPVEAVGAYQKALEIEPGFIRARYNVGVVCINLKSYKEAAEHLLLALNHQATSKQRAGVNVENVQNQMSDTLWSTLRMTISLAGKHELQDFIDKRDLESLNKEFGM